MVGCAYAQSSVVTCQSTVQSCIPLVTTVYKQDAFEAKSDLARLRIITQRAHHRKLVVALGEQSRSSRGAVCLDSSWPVGSQTDISGRHVMQNTAVHYDVSTKTCHAFTFKCTGLLLAC
jgi:hypothetical protein